MYIWTRGGGLNFCNEKSLKELRCLKVLIYPLKLVSPPDKLPVCLKSK